MKKYVYLFFIISIITLSVAGMMHTDELRKYREAEKHNVPSDSLKFIKDSLVYTIDSLKNEIILRDKVIIDYIASDSTYDTASISIDSSR